MMQAELVDTVVIMLRCRGCGARSDIRSHVIVNDGVVALHEAELSSYCNCAGGGNVRHRLQIAVTLDPEKRPVMKVVPVSEA